MSMPNSRTRKRTPAQSRGELRVSIILDACARLLVKNSSTNFTMHGLAQEAKTSIGSLYHFFADKQAVIDALVVRHVEGGGKILEKLESVPDRQWIEWPPRTVMLELHSLNIEYVQKNPEVRILWNEARFNTRNGSVVNLGLLALYEKVLTLRMPQASKAQLSQSAQALYRLPMGFLLWEVPGDDQSSWGVFTEEAPRALTAYLEAIEREYAGNTLTCAV